jgi:hypothetical protein
MRLGVIAVGVLVILAFAGSSAYDAWRAYRNSLAATDRELDNVARALAEQTAWIWQGIDLLLRDTARWYQNDGRTGAPERVGEVLANRAAGMRQIRLLTIVDAQGIQRYRSHGFATPDLDVSDRSYFTAQRDGAARGLFMSEPLVTRSENRAAVELSRRLDDDAGFAGVVTAIVDLEDLQQFYQAVNPGPGSAIQLLREDGTLLVRNPAATNEVGKKFTLLVAVPSAHSKQSRNPSDGRRDFIAIARQDTPLQIAVTRSESVALGHGATRRCGLARRTPLLQHWES